MPEHKPHPEEPADSLPQQIFDFAIKLWALEMANTIRLNVEAELRRP